MSAFRRHIVIHKSYGMKARYAIDRLRVGIVVYIIVLHGSPTTGEWMRIASQY